MSITYRTQEEKIITSASNDYLKIGQKKGYFVLDDNKIKYLAQGKQYNFLEQEEKVRAEYYFELIEKYKYPAEKIFFDVDINDSELNGTADIVAYSGINKPYIVVECEKDGISDVEFEQAVKRVVANARVLKAPFAVVVAGNVHRVMEIEKWDEEDHAKAIVEDVPVCC